MAAIRSKMCGFRVVNGKWQLVKFAGQPAPKETPLDTWIRNMESALYRCMVPRYDLDEDEE